MTCFIYIFLLHQCPYWSSKGGPVWACLINASNTTSVET